MRAPFRSRHKHVTAALIVSWLLWACSSAPDRASTPDAGAARGGDRRAADDADSGDRSSAQQLPASGEAMASAAGSGGAPSAANSSANVRNLAGAGAAGLPASARAAGGTLASPHPSDDNFIHLQSDDGDPIGRGKRFDYTVADALLVVGYASGTLSVAFTSRFEPSDAGTHPNRAR